MFYFIVGYLFLFVFRPYEVWSFLAPLHIERIYMLGLLASVLFWKKRRFISHPITNAVIAFFMVMIAASFFAVSSSEAFEKVFEYFKLLVFYFIIVLTIQDEEELKNFVLAYVVIIAMYVGKSAYEFFVNDHHWYRMGIRRMMGADVAYSDPNYFAGSICYSLPFLWAMIRMKLEKKWVKAILWGYAVLALVAVVYSGSRSGMVTTLMFFILVWLGSSRKAVGLILLPVILAVIWSFMPESYQDRFESTFVAQEEAEGKKGAEASAQGRINGLKQGFKTFTERPLLGIGPGNFKYAWAGGTGEIIGGSAHNMYGQLLGELGGLGFISFFTMVGLIYSTHRRARDKISQIIERFGEELPAENIARLNHLSIISTSSIQMLILLLFNGNFGHNLYRYNYLWLGAVGVLCSYFATRAYEELRDKEEPSMNFMT